VLAGVLDLLDAGSRSLDSWRICSTTCAVRCWISATISPTSPVAARRTRGQTANLVGHHRKTTTVLPGPGRFDGGVQGQQIGLTGNGLNHQGHALDIVAAQAQGFDQFPAVIGALTELMHAR
jgi:hypothetical protein